MKCNCDLCGADSPRAIEVTLKHTKTEPLYVCGECGLVYVPESRTTEEVDEDWSDDANPAVAARHEYVSTFVYNELGWKDKSVLDIGDSTGGFSNGTRFDIATILWTLENAVDPAGMLKAVWEFLDDDGHVVVATGSRLLVPFKKPMNMYLKPNSPFTRYSANTLRGMLHENRFEVVAENRWIDSDVMVMIAQKRQEKTPWIGDQAWQLVAFFNQWDSAEWHSTQVGADLWQMKQ